MAPPLRKGTALARQRVGGLVFLAVLAGLIGLAIALYAKAFTPVVTVTLSADRIGNQLQAGGDVKARGVIVGEVRSVRADVDGAEIELALDRDQVGLLPADVQARLLPKTLFGEKFVALIVDDGSSAPPLADGDVIAQDRSSTAVETSQALDNALPLLRTLKPEQVSLTLNALSGALRGRGDQVGENLVLTRDYLARFNPELPTLAEDFRGVADLADTFEAGADDLVQVLDNLSFVNRSLVDTEAELDGFLRDSTGIAGLSQDFLAENEQRFITLAAESVPNLGLYDEFSPQYPCLLDGIVRSLELGDTFGGFQPGLHITLEVVENLEPYVPGDEPEYLEDGTGPTCFGLEGEPIRPFPTYRNPQDGHRDDQTVDPQTGRGDGPPPSGPGGEQTYDDQRQASSASSASATPFSPASYDRAAVGLAVAPTLGVTPREVPDVAVLLFGPVARDTVVRPA